MDKSNFDIVKCSQQGCDFWHILLTDGYNSKEDTIEQIKWMIGNVPQWRETNEHCPKCGVKGEQDRVYKGQYRCNNSQCSVIEFFDDVLEPVITLDEQVWLDEPETTKEDKSDPI